MGIGISTIEGKAESEKRPWADLPHDILLLIFQKLGSIDLLLSAQAVCTSWRQLALEPRLWHCIDLRLKPNYLKPNNLNDCVMEKLTFKAIDRSNGYIEEFYAGGFIWDDTLTYIGNRTSGLTRFGLIAPRGFTEKALMEFICHCPLLEELEITHYLVSPEDCENIKRACPKLKCLKLNMETNKAQDWSPGDYRGWTDWEFEASSNSGSYYDYRIRTPWEESETYGDYRIRTERESEAYDNYRNQEKPGLMATTMGIGISTIEGKAESEKRPWADLPHDILLLIFQKLGTIDLLLSAQAVCTSWRQLALEPRLWHCIDLRLKPNNLNDCVMEKLTFKAIDRSNGYIEEFYAGGFIWDDTFTYIGNRTSGLTRFGLIAPRGFTKKVLMEFICHCPLLEELEITHYLVTTEDSENIKRTCPKLKRLKLNMETNEAYYRSELDRGMSEAYYRSVLAIWPTTGVLAGFEQARLLNAQHAHFLRTGWDTNSDSESDFTGTLGSDEWNW